VADAEGIGVAEGAEMELVEVPGDAAETGEEDVPGDGSGDGNDSSL